MKAYRNGGNRLTKTLRGKSRRAAACSGGIGKFFASRGVRGGFRGGFKAVRKPFAPRDYTVTYDF